MKTKIDPRHQKRQKIVRHLFAAGFSPKQPLDANSKDILKNKDTINSIISQAAPMWPLSQISKIDLVILQLAVFELIIKPDQPQKVVIDEAVELAKEFGGESSSAFVNGVLGTIVKKEQEIKK